MYLGVAVVMIFEVIELVIDVGLNFWRKKIDRKKVEEEQDDKKRSEVIL